MKKIIPFSIIISLYFPVSFAQNKQIKDSTIILPGDIYSNSSKENYRRARSTSFFITKDKNDSIKILSVSYVGLIDAGDKFYKKKFIIILY